MTTDKGRQHLKRAITQTFIVGTIIGLLRGLALGFAIGKNRAGVTLVVPLTEGIKT